MEKNELALKLTSLYLEHFDRNNELDKREIKDAYTIEDIAGIYHFFYNATDEDQSEYEEKFFVKMLN